MPRGVATLVLLIAVVSCGGDDAAAPTPLTESPTTRPASTSAPSTSAPTTAAPATSASSEPETTAPNCTGIVSTSSRSSTDPLMMSSLFGKDIRTGAHPCFERIVIELQGSGEFPGWTVEYQDDPIVLEESDEKVSIEGDATIVARVGSWMQTMEYEGYAGPRDIIPTNVSHILELRLVENFEGVTRWAIGIDRQRPFAVTQLSDPPRLVIDIDTSS